MESRKTRSASKPTLTITPVPQKRVKTVSIPALDLAKLKVAKPMLVIPQPVLQSHDCLDETIGMAQIESNAYIALGVKEEPLEEYSEYGLSCEQTDNNDYQTEVCTQMSEPYVEIEGRRMTRSAIRRQIGSFETTHSEDSNNNSSKPKKRASKPKREKEMMPEFRPIVLSVCSLAPGYSPEGSPLEKDSSKSSLEASTEEQTTPLNNNNKQSFEGNNNEENTDVETQTEKPKTSENVMEKEFTNDQTSVPTERTEDSPKKANGRSKVLSATKEAKKKRSEKIIDDTPSNSSECESEKPSTPIKRKLRERKSITPATKADETEPQEEAEEKEAIDDEIEEEEDEYAEAHDPDSDNFEPETSSEEESEEEQAEEEPSTTRTDLRSFLMFRFIVDTSCYSQTVGPEGGRAQLGDLQRVREKVLARVHPDGAQEEALRPEGVQLRPLQQSVQQREQLQAPHRLLRPYVYIQHTHPLPSIK